MHWRLSVLLLNLLFLYFEKIWQLSFNQIQLLYGFGCIADFGKKHHVGSNYSFEKFEYSSDITDEIEEIVCDS